MVKWMLNISTLLYVIELLMAMIFEG